MQKFYWHNILTLIGLHQVYNTQHMHMYAGNIFSHMQGLPPGACGLHPYWTHAHLNLLPPRPTILHRKIPANPKPNSTHTLQQQSMYQCLTSEQNQLHLDTKITVELQWNFWVAILQSVYKQQK